MYLTSYKGLYKFDISSIILKFKHMKSVLIDSESYRGIMSNFAALVGFRVIWGNYVKLC